eukprot:1156388-Pelagomonas_calceolata.AAC.11
MEPNLNASFLGKGKGSANCASQEMRLKQRWFWTGPLHGSRERQRVQAKERCSQRSYCSVEGRKEDTCTAAGTASQATPRP